MSFLFLFLQRKGNRTKRPVEVLDVNRLLLLIFVGR